MPFLGNIINTAAVIVGSLIGLTVKRGVSEKMQETLMQALGMCTVFVGISGTLSNMFSVTGDKAPFSLNVDGTLLLIVSMVVGTLIGQLIDIEDKLERLGDLLQSKVTRKGDAPGFTEGFVSASLIICVGAMAIVGGINDGMGHPETLIAKSVLDFTIVLIFASTMGVGVTFSALPMFLYQSIFCAIGLAAGNIMSEQMITDLSVVGNVLIFGVGINLLFKNILGDRKLRVGNMLPALIIPVIYDLIVQG